SGSRFDTAYPRDWIRRIGVSWIRRIDFFWIWRIDLLSFVVFGECRHRYTVSSLMDTVHW
ncbi:hypothetical protein Tco_0292517, partial [Tanacetum coccineum]